jgi:polysaccharide export outer membrane protein
MRHLVIICLIVGFLFTSCSYKQDQALFERKTTTSGSVPQKDFSNIGNYRIKPQDILQINNIQNNKNIIDLSAGVAVTAGGSSGAAGSAQGDNYVVEDDGTIALPGLGRIQIAGLTRVEARKHIEELYGKELKQPLLDVKLVNLKVNVTGEVRSPGNILLTKDRPTLIEILGEAGGLTEKSDEKHIKIIRTDNNSTVDVIDLSDIKSLTDPRIILQNNDIVYVSQNRKAIRNSSIQDFSTIIQPALILFNTALIILTLVRK